MNEGVESKELLVWSGGRGRGEVGGGSICRVNKSPGYVPEGPTTNMCLTVTPSGKPITTPGNPYSRFQTGTPGHHSSTVVFSFSWSHLF